MIEAQTVYSGAYCASGDGGLEGKSRGGTQDLAAVKRLGCLVEVKFGESS